MISLKIKHCLNPLKNRKSNFSVPNLHWSLNSKGLNSNQKKNKSFNQKLAKEPADGT